MRNLLLIALFIAMSSFTVYRYWDDISFQEKAQNNSAGIDTSTYLPRQFGTIPRSFFTSFKPILPNNRIIAYYGNFYSKNMGVLGEYPPHILLPKFKEEIKKWEMAEPALGVVPAIHYIAMVAQGDAGKDGFYRLKMPDSQIDSAINLAKKIDNAIVFIDLQVGWSDIETELPRFEKYLKLPNVHLALDPEFALKTKRVPPGKLIGTMDAENVNFAINYLQSIVQQEAIPPKVLVVHRFTKNMLTNYAKIKKVKEVQVVINMDGWGHPELKLNTYRSYVAREVVQYTGFKLFYKNDLKNNGRILTPQELVRLSPKPLYIQYQ